LIPRAGKANPNCDYNDAEPCNSEFIGKLYYKQREELWLHIQQLRS